MSLEYVVLQGKDSIPFWMGFSYIWCWSCFGHGGCCFGLLNWGTINLLGWLI